LCPQEKNARFRSASEAIEWPLLRGEAKLGDMGRLLGLLGLAVAGLGCGGLAHSRHGELEPIVLPDAGAALPSAPDPLSTPDAGLGSRAPVEPECGADGVVHGSAEIRRQEDVDALASCWRIAGNLSLHDASFDMTPLLSLRVIEGQLWVDGSGGPRKGVRQEALDGFRSLEQVGALTLLRVSVTDLGALGRLHSIGLDAREPREFDLALAGHPGLFEITECAGFASLAGLDSLEQATELTLARNSELQSLAGMPQLRRIDKLSSKRTPLTDLGGVGPAVQELSLSSTALTQLAGLGNASLLQRLTLSRNGQLTSLEGGTFPEQMVAVSSTDDALVSLKGLENLKTLETLEVSSGSTISRLETLAGLDRLVQVGSLTLEGQTRLSSLAGLGSLERAGQVLIREAAALPNLVGLAKLQQVDSFSLQAPALTELTGLGKLTVNQLSLSTIAVTSLTGLDNATIADLSLFQARRLTTLDGFAPSNVMGGIQIYEAPLLADIQALAGLTQLGFLYLQNTSIADLDALSQLRRLGGLTLASNPRLSQLDAVSGVSGLGLLSLSENATLRTSPRFENVTGTDCGDCGPFTLQIWNNAILTNGPALPALAAASSIEVIDNPALTSFSGLSALRSVESLWVQTNPKLASLDLSELQQGVTILIRQNASLDDAPLARLRNIAQGERIKIVSNASGPARLSPCPWLGDGECDELNDDCAAGSDVSDCRN
jgi:hypothetical protein